MTTSFVLDYGLDSELFSDWEDGLQEKWITYLIATLITAAIFAIQPAAAQDTEKRSSIHEVDGFAYLSEDKTLGQVRSEAFALAKRQALEASRTYIQSKTRVEDGSLSYDLVWSEADGSVTIMDQKDYGVVENSRYHVWIKAEVFYSANPKTTVSVPPAKPHGTGNPMMLDSGPLTVNVWTEKKRYVQGEDVVVYLQGNRDFSAVVADVMADGQIIQLLPNEHRTDNLFKAGVRYRIPGPEDRFSLTVSPPFGVDSIVVYASEVPMDSLPTRSLKSGLGLFNGTQNGMAATARGIVIQPKEEKSSSQGIEFFEAHWSFSTAER